jgi:hypothetical protein
MRQMPTLNLLEKAKEALGATMLCAVEGAQKPHASASRLMRPFPRHLYSLRSLIIREEQRLMMFEDGYRGEMCT